MVQGVEAFGASLDFGGEAIFDHFFANGVLNFVEKLLLDFGFGGDFFLQFEKSGRLQIAEGEVFQFTAHQAHAKTVGDRGVNVESFSSDTLLAVGRKIFEGAHVVKTIGEFHQNDANVIDHGEQHFANVFSLTRLGSHQIDTADFRGTLDDASHVRAEHFRDLLDGNSGVFDDIVE